MSNPLTADEIDALKTRGYFVDVNNQIGPVLRYITGPYVVHKGIAFQRGNNFGSGDVMFYRDEDSNRFHMGTTNEPIDTIHANTIHSTGYYVLSDARVKSNLRIIENVLNTMDEIRTYMYTMPDTMNNSEQIGMLAQEIEKVYPEVVTTDPETGTKSVNYNSMVAILWKAVKELKYQHADSVRDNTVKAAHIKQLRDEVAELKRDIEGMRELFQKSMV